MIKQPDYPPVLYYAYRPLQNDLRRFSDDGGFSATLYQDDRFVFTHYGVDQSLQCRTTYVVPDAARAAYLKAVDSTASWLGGVPAVTRLPANKAPRLESRFGFQGYPLLIVEDIPMLVRSPFMDPDGRTGRRLCTLLEDISEIFLPYGIGLYLDGYTIESRFMQPIETIYADDLRNTGAMAF